MNTEAQPQIATDEAACITNYHGRILWANQRFCRLFGYEKGEAEWHYLVDLYRHPEEWLGQQGYLGELSQSAHYITRLKNRRGRSFSCMVTRAPIDPDSLGMRYLTTIHKVPKVLPDTSALEKVGRTAVMNVGHCAHCNKVKLATGDWVVASEVSRFKVPGPKLPVYCPECTEKLFPGLFVQSGSEVMAMAE